MTVSELIKELETLPQDKPVKFLSVYGFTENVDGAYTLEEFEEVYLTQRIEQHITIAQDIMNLQNWLKDLPRQ